MIGKPSEEAATTTLLEQLGEREGAVGEGRRVKGGEGRGRAGGWAGRVEWRAAPLGSAVLCSAGLSGVLEARRQYRHASRLGSPSARSEELDTRPAATSP